jgi:transcription antitermination factor NusG
MGELLSALDLAEVRGRSPYAAGAAVEAAAIDAVDADWHAIWTRSNFEDLVGRQLMAKGFEVFFPTAATWSRRANARRRVEVPLFPGYLFVQQPIDKAAYIEILKVRGVVRVLGDGWDRLAPIDFSEIEAIQRLVRAGQPMFPHMYLRAGDRVRITAGPLRGVEGFFVRDQLDKGLLVVSVTLLQRSVAVKVDCTIVEAA